MVTASDVANAVMAATVKADTNQRQGNTNTATGTSSGGNASVLSQTNVPASTSSSTTATTTSTPSSSTIDTEETDYSVPPDLTLSELEAITDLARESVLEREKTELALIKANIVADTADDDDEANERNIENKHSGGVAVAASKIPQVTSTQSGGGHITLSHSSHLPPTYVSLSAHYFHHTFIFLSSFSTHVSFVCPFCGIVL